MVRDHNVFMTRQVVFALMEYINKSHISSRELGIDFLGDYPHRGSSVFWTPPPVYPTDISHSTCLRPNCTVIYKQIKKYLSPRYKESETNVHSSCMI